MSNIKEAYFSSAEKQILSYEEILENVQNHCTKEHSKSLSNVDTSDEARQLLKEYIENYIFQQGYFVNDMNSKELSLRIFDDMADYSFLRKWIYMPGLEELNINSYNDIEIIMQGKRSEKIPDKFSSPSRAIDVMRRMLSSCGMIIDDSMPSVIGFLDKNIRIQVDKTPIVDSDVGINASIRIVNQQTVSKEKMIAEGSATEEMMDFLMSCVKHGISVCIAGSTGSGKTTVMSWLLSTIPNDRRVITIEEGSREFDLVKRDNNGEVINSVAHLLTRPHENPAMNIDQEFLLERVLRKHPDIIGVGEMRAAGEAMAAQEASRTGHTVVTTIHSNSCESTYRRMMTLAKLKNDLSDEMLMRLMVEAYPVIVFTKQLEDRSRKIMEIIEGISYENNKLQYKTLYKYQIKSNIANKNEKIKIVGKHDKISKISQELRKRFLDSGISNDELKKFTGEDNYNGLD